MPTPATGDPSFVVGHPQARKVKFSGYIWTAMISGANIVAIIVVTGILARAWDEPRFLLYGQANRYLNFLFCIANGGLGYAIVRNSWVGEETQRKRVLFNSLCLIGVLTLMIGAIILLFANRISATLNESRFTRDWTIPCVLWLFGQSFLHILLAHLRSSDQLKLANKVHWCAKTLCLLTAAGTIWILGTLAASGTTGTLGNTVPLYYGIVGMLVLTTCTVGFITQWKNIEPTLDPKLCVRMLGFSSTRVADAILKNAFLVLLITQLSMTGYERLAGQVAVITFLLRGIEALCSPLVMLVMTDSLARDSEERVRELIETKWLALFVFSVPIMLVLYFFSEPITTLYLSHKHAGLAPEVGLISLSLLPTVAVVLFRGHLDGKLKVSPVMYSNIIGLAAIGGVTWWLHDNKAVTLHRITEAIVVIRWLQFAFILWVLRRTFHVSLYRREVLAQIISRIRSRF